MTGPWRWMLLPLYLHYLSMPTFRSEEKRGWMVIRIKGATAKATYVQEFLPRSLSPYGDGLEGAQLLQIPMPQQSGALLLSVAANVTRGCSWTNITLYNYLIHSSLYPSVWCILLPSRYLRHDGLPIVNVQNASYPNYTWVNEPVDYEINFLSDSLPHNLTINFRDSSLMIFGAAFLMEESTKIQQDVFNPIEIRFTSWVSTFIHPFIPLGFDQDMHNPLLGPGWNSTAGRGGHHSGRSNRRSGHFPISQEELRPASYSQMDSGPREQHKFDVQQCRHPVELAIRGSTGHFTMGCGVADRCGWNASGRRQIQSGYLLRRKRRTLHGILYFIRYTVFLILGPEECKCFILFVAYDPSLRKRDWGQCRHFVAREEG